MVTKHRLGSTGRFVREIQTKTTHADQTTTVPSHQGFTMIEVLITLVLLMVALVGLAGLQLNTVRQVSVSKRSGEATRLAQVVLERYSAMPYTSLAAFVPKSVWFTEVRKDNVSTMVNVGVDGESTGPFTVQSLHENVGGGELVTVRVQWATIKRGNEITPSQQYRTFNITLALHRFP